MKELVDAVEVMLSKEVDDSVIFSKEFEENMHQIFIKIVAGHVG